MSGPIIFVTTMRIEEGALEDFKEAARRSTEFLEAEGPQLMAQVFIEEEELRAHGLQVHRDSASILAHWQLADPYMREVMQHVTTTRVDIYGVPSEAVMEGMRRLSSQGAIVTATPRFAGFSRLADSS